MLLYHHSSVGNYLYYLYIYIIYIINIVLYRIVIKIINYYVYMMAFTFFLAVLKVKTFALVV